MYKTWKGVVGLENLYEVSSTGEIRALRREGSPGRELKPQVNQNTGYVKVNLCVNGVCVSKEIHRLVAGAFIPNKEQKPMVNHKNGVKSGDRADISMLEAPKDKTR